jgi:hypothetical protein
MTETSPLLQSALPLGAEFDNACSAAKLIRSVRIRCSGLAVGTSLPQSIIRLLVRLSNRHATVAPANLDVPIKSS